MRAHELCVVLLAALSLSLLGASCAEANTPSQPPAEARGSGAEAWRRCSERSDAGAPASLRDVDWCNREYVAGLVALRAGRGEMHDYVEPGGLHDTTLTSLREVQCADLDGDGAEEALVALDGQDYLGAAMHSVRYTWLFVFEWKHAAPLQTASERVGRAEEVKVTGSEIQIRFREGNEHCRRRYRVRGATLEQDRNLAECAPVE